MVRENKQKVLMHVLLEELDEGKKTKGSVKEKHRARLFWHCRAKEQTSTFLIRVRKEVDEVWIFFFFTNEGNRFGRIPQVGFHRLTTGCEQINCVFIIKNEWFGIQIPMY